MSLVRSTLFQLAAKKPVPSHVALTVAKPMVAVLSGRPLSSAALSRKEATGDRDATEEQLVNSNYSDAFDESDALETGKKQTPHLKTSSSDDSSERSPSWAEKALRRTYGKRRQLLDDFDDFFGSSRGDPFAPFFSRRQPLMNKMILKDHPFDSFFPPSRLRDAFFSGRKLDTDLFRWDLNDPDDGGFKLIRSSAPKVDIEESDTDYKISVDIPKALDDSNVKVELDENGHLHISGRIRVENKEANKVSETSFDRIFSIGDNVNTEELKATFLREKEGKDHTLVVTAPKLEAATTEITNARVEIPMTVTDALPSEEEINTKTFGDAFDESDFEEVRKKQVEQEIS